MDELFLGILQGLGWPAALFGITVILYRAGLLSILAGRFQGIAENRVAELEQFKVEAEANHFHDLDEVIKKVEGLTQDFNKYQLDSERRFTRLESKVFNGTGNYKP